MICIGGVCIPESAIIPLILVGVRWVFAKLQQFGLLPPFFAKMVGLNAAPPPPTTTSISSETASKTSASGENTAPKSSDVQKLESQERFDALLASNEAFVVKFTADWCGPCQKIHPFYQKRCEEYTSHEFITVDVDDFDEIAGKYSIAMMPTFLVLKGSTVVGTYRGSSEPELETFLSTHLR